MPALMAAPGRHWPPAAMCTAAAAAAELRQRPGAEHVSCSARSTARTVRAAVTSRASLAGAGQDGALPWRMHDRASADSSTPTESGCKAAPPARPARR